MVLDSLNGYTSLRSNALLRAAPPEGEGAVSWLRQRFPYLVSPRNYEIVGYFGLERKFPSGSLPTSEAIIIIRNSATSRLCFVYRENVYSGDLGNGFVGPAISDTFSKQRIIDAVEQLLGQVGNQTQGLPKFTPQPICPVARTHV